MEVFRVGTKRDLAAFIEFPYSLYAGDPLYVPQLRKEMREKFSDKNPFSRHAEIAYFLARKEGRIVGRVASIFNKRHLEFHSDGAGFFGFFECENDRDVAAALIDRVSAELGTKGLRTIRGPMNFSTNEECGFLTEGFGEPPMIMTPYNPPYYNTLMESIGMTKAKDLLAFLHEVQERLPDKVLRVAAIVEKRGVRVRPIDKSRFDREMHAFKEVYNDAWEMNWGFIPLTDDELMHLGNQLKQIVVPELTLIAEDKGSPVGFLGLLPDFNFVLKRMGGSLGPLSILKALYFSRKIKDLRLLLLGIKQGYRNKGVDALLYREGFAGIRKGGYRRIEFSWVLEDNEAIHRIVEMVGGRVYKRYRLYEKAIAPSV